MSLKRALATSAMLTACCPSVDRAPAGPTDPDWMLDTFTHGLPGSTYLSYSLSVSNYEFREDATGARITIATCGATVYGDEFVWERREGDTIAIVAGPATDSMFSPDTDEWRLTPAKSCFSDDLEAISVEAVRDGAVFEERVFVRGAICLAPYEDPTCPEGYECNDCQTVWCEPPPPCEEAAPEGS
jgi:hypothetical protein